MKKIIEILTIGLAFFTMSKNCYAVVVTNGNVVPDIKIQLKTDKINEIRKIYQITDLNSNKSLYSMDLENTNYNGGYDIDDFYGSENHLNEELKNKISLIAYFGYGYKNRIDIKWYVITQYLIWNELIKNENGEIYFIDSNDNRIDLYKNEIEGLRKDIEHFSKIPSFLEANELKSEYNLKLTGELIFNDQNNILNEYEIATSSNDLEYKLNNNKLTIIPINPNLVNISFQRKVDNLGDYIKIYTNSASQKLISRGNINLDVKSIIININFPKVKIKSTTMDVSKFNIEENKYSIFSEDNQEFYSNIVLDKTGLSEEYILNSGKYYLKQTKNAYGYKLNEEKIYFEIGKEDLIINVTNELETKHVTIEKQLIKDGNELVLDANIKLNIYDNDNKLIKEIITNNEGRAFVDLAYGTYKIVEDKSKRNLGEIATLTINENFNENEIIIIKENLESDDIEIGKEIKTGNIIINKYDYLTGKPLPGLKIGLFNKNKELISEALTDITGKVIFKDIETGTYYIKEILKDKDSELEGAIEVEVKDGIDTIITSNNRTKIEVPDTMSKECDMSIAISLLFIGIGIYQVKNEKKNNN